MFYSITFAPAFERERRFRNDENVEVSLGSCIWDKTTENFLTLYLLGF